MIASEPLVNTVYLNPSIDAIEEVKVQTGSYSAEYGMNNGAIVQLALKSGSNAFHGTFYEFLRNDAADAKDYFLNFQLPAGTPLQGKNRLRRNQYGTWLAGPVFTPTITGARTKLFGVSISRAHADSGKRAAGHRGQFFPAAFRNGDFSALLHPAIINGKPVRAPIIIYNPLNGQPFTDAAGKITNIIPANLINKNAQALVNKYVPLPQFSPTDILDVNSIVAVPNILNQNQYFARIDHLFNPKDRIFGRFASQVGQWDVGNINPNFLTRSTSGITTSPSNICIFSAPLY